MSGQFIPDDRAQFILEKIDSVAQLEALLLLLAAQEISAASKLCHAGSTSLSSDAISTESPV